MRSQVQLYQILMNFKTWCLPYQTILQSRVYRSQRYKIFWRKKKIQRRLKYNLMIAAVKHLESLAHVWKRCPVQKFKLKSQRKSKKIWIRKRLKKRAWKLWFKQNYKIWFKNFDESNKSNFTFKFMSLSLILSGWTWRSYKSSTST